jgi:hypothetical protein
MVAAIVMVQASDQRVMYFMVLDPHVERARMELRPTVIGEGDGALGTLDFGKAFERLAILAANLSARRLEA